MKALRSNTYLQAAQADTQTQACKKVCLPNRTTDRQTFDRKEQRRHNSTYPKVAVQWLNQALCFYQSLCLAESEVLRNRHLRLAAKRYRAF
jgi:hypothetical protein